MMKIRNHQTRVIACTLRSDKGTPREILFKPGVNNIKESVWDALLRKGKTDERNSYLQTHIDCGHLSDETPVGTAKENKDKVKADKATKAMEKRVEADKAKGVKNQEAAAKKAAADAKKAGAPSLS